MQAQSLILLLLAATMAGTFEAAVAGSCNVPGSHPTIQAAVDDPGCSDIELSNQAYFELLNINRSLHLFGPPGGGATVTGQVNVVGGEAVVELSSFKIESGCADGALRVQGGARVTGLGMQAEYESGTPCTVGLIFEDGFEG